MYLYTILVLHFGLFGFLFCLLCAVSQLFQVAQLHAQKHAQIGIFDLGQNNLTGTLIVVAQQLGHSLRVLHPDAIGATGHAAGGGFRG